MAQFATAVAPALEPQPMTMKLDEPPITAEHKMAEVATFPSPSPAASKPPAPKPQAPIQVEELPHLQLPRAEDVRPPRRDFSDHYASGIPWRLVAVAAVTVVLALVLWIRHSRAARPATAMANTQATTNQVAPTQPASSSSPAPPPSQPPSAPRSPAPASATPAAHTEESADVTVRNFDKSASQSASADKGSGSLTLVIRASENSWISVLADGQLVTQETLIAPANTSVHASREITVRIGNAAGLTFLFNGQEVPAQGDESEVKTLVFDASGFKSVPGQLPTEN